MMMVWYYDNVDDEDDYVDDNIVGKIVVVLKEKAKHSLVTKYRKKQAGKL